MDCFYEKPLRLINFFLVLMTFTAHFKTKKRTFASAYSNKELNLRSTSVVIPAEILPSFLKHWVFALQVLLLTI